MEKAFLIIIWGLRGILTASHFPMIRNKYVLIESSFIQDRPDLMD